MANDSSPATPCKASTREPTEAAAVFFITFSLFILFCAWQEHARVRVAPRSLPPAMTHLPAPQPARAENPPRKNLAEKKESHAATYRRLGAYVARRYRISAAVATDIVEKAHAIGHQLKLDPFLILAVISVESRFNPSAESNRGAKGLMQVMPRWHADKLDAVGGEEKVFDPGPNIMVGARILKEYLLPTGDLDDALQRYVGASSEDEANEYAGKIAREREILTYVGRHGAAPRTSL